MQSTLTTSSTKEMDMKVLHFMDIINNKKSVSIPEPTEFVISTQSAMCNISGTNEINLSKIVVFIGEKIIKNIILKENVNYLIQGMVVNNLILRFDES